jgi:hypothetical protein
MTLDEFAADTTWNPAGATVCGICGHGIGTGARSVHRVSGRLTAAHTTCRDEMRDAERLARRQDAIDARQERKAAILRGDIA